MGPGLLWAHGSVVCSPLALWCSILAFGVPFFSLWEFWCFLDFSLFFSSLFVVGALAFSVACCCIFLGVFVSWVSILVFIYILLFKNK